MQPPAGAPTTVIDAGIHVDPRTGGLRMFERPTDSLSAIVLGTDAERNALAGGEFARLFDGSAGKASWEPVATNGVRTFENSPGTQSLVDQVVLGRDVDFSGDTQFDPEFIQIFDGCAGKGSWSPSAEERGDGGLRPAGQKPTLFNGAIRPAEVEPVAASGSPTSMSRQRLFKEMKSRLPLPAEVPRPPHVHRLMCESEEWASDQSPVQYPVGVPVERGRRRCCAGPMGNLAVGGLLLTANVEGAFSPRSLQTSPRGILSAAAANQVVGSPLSAGRQPNPLPPLKAVGAGYVAS